MTNQSGYDANDERRSVVAEERRETIIDKEKMAETTVEEESHDEKPEEDPEPGEGRRLTRVSIPKHSNGKTFKAKGIEKVRMGRNQQDPKQVKEGIILQGPVLQRLVLKSNSFGLFSV